MITNTAPLLVTVFTVFTGTLTLTLTLVYNNRLSKASHTIHEMDILMVPRLVTGKIPIQNKDNRKLIAYANKSAQTSDNIKFLIGGVLKEKSNVLDTTDFREELSKKYKETLMRTQIENFIHQSFPQAIISTEPIVLIYRETSFNLKNVDKLIDWHRDSDKRSKYRATIMIRNDMLGTTNTWFSLKRGEKPTLNHVGDIVLFNKDLLHCVTYEQPSDAFPPLPIPPSFSRDRIVLIVEFDEFM